ncbi:MAG: hypothetical protein SV375_01620 [Thermodesulfobacteriota bacterium]|nr:hypothetical protein [Thermodesulfobacteriota bacterium]
MFSDSQDTFSALNELRDRALMLLLGNAYICEEPIIIKLGLEIDSYARKLKDDILSLKKKFPGKFTHEINTDEIVDGIQNTAQLMQKPDSEINEKCTIGMLGRELETSLNTLTTSINDIKNQIEGASTVYTWLDSFSKLFVAIQKIGKALGRSLTFFLKILFLLIIISLLFFSYLFLTMEREGEFKKVISQREAHILLQKDMLSELNNEHKELLEKIASIENKKTTRELKITIMELRNNIHEINEKRNRVEAEIEIHEKKIEENQKKIEEIKKRSFIQRLLRLK